MNGSEMVAEAIVFAAEKHKGQVRKDGTAFIYHPIRVATALKDYGYDETHQIVGILHDTLEDTDTTEDELRQKFGDEVLSAVKAVTRNDGEDEDNYVARVLGNPIAAAVKMMDKIDNVMAASIVDDYKWGKMYIKKAKIYYYNKFSPALDEAIGTAKWRRSFVHASYEPWPKFTPDSVKLYSVLEKEQYEAGKIEREKYKNLQPDIRHKDAQLWHDSNIGTYYCYFKNSSLYRGDEVTWILRRYGWEPVARTPFDGNEYGDGLFHSDYDRYVRDVNYMKSNGYFFDYVTDKELFQN